MSSPSLVIGLTGPNASGKGEIARYLGRLGFEVHSLSDIVREEARALGLPPEREHLIRVGNRLRQAGGPGVLAERILPRLGGRDVVDSIRSPAEVEVLRRLPRFILLGVSAPAELRFRRSVARGRTGDAVSLEQFLERERQENTSDPTAQRLEETLGLADRRVDNSGDLCALHAALEHLVREVGSDAGLAGGDDLAG